MNILNGDCLEAMKKLDENSIDSMVTDPPYGIKFMAKKWDDDCPSVEVWKESLRVLKPGGHALVFSGTRTIDLIIGRMREAGYEIRDCITWLYGSGFPKSHNISKGIDKKFGAETEKIVSGKSGSNRNSMTGNFKGGEYYKEIASTDQAKQWDGWGTALKPSTEHCVLARKNGVDIVRFNVINKTLCQYLLHVLTVEKNLMSSQAELKEALNIVQCLAEKNTSTLENLLDQMDMLQSKLMGSSFLNTVILWKNVLKESLENMSKFTMSMETNLIIELKILNYCLLETIQDCTTKEEMKQSGQQLNVLSVESLFKNVLIKLSYILNIDVSSNVLDNLSPACEFIVLARKPLSEKTVVNNVLKHGTGGINIDKSRVPANNEVWENSEIQKSLYVNAVEKIQKHITQVIREYSALDNVDTNLIEKALGKMLVNTTTEVTQCLEKILMENINLSLSMCLSGKTNLEKNQEDVLSTIKTEIKKIIESKICNYLQEKNIQNYIINSATTHSIGRFPANLILDEEAGKMLDEQHTTNESGYRKNPSTNKSTWYGAKDGSHIEGERSYDDKGGASRFFYCAKTSKSERNKGLEGMEEKQVHRYGAGIGEGKTPEAPSIDKNNHPTVKPQKLMQYLCKLITPQNGTILDCFMGSGSTGVAARTLGFDFIGIEREKEYYDIAKERIEAKLL